MKRLILAIVLLAFTAFHAPAQSLDDLNLQLHGYATQAFLYSNQNSWNTTDSENGSASWTEAVLNISAQPDPKLRIGVQARFFVLGDYGQTFTLDWAQADYKFNEHLGVRAGKVKTPVGLLNETQDIDPAQLWVLLPQAIYPITSRNSLLSHYGGVLYGAVPLGESFGKLEYRAFAGQRVLGADDGYLRGFQEQNINVPNGVTGHTSGGTLHWVTPLHGLMAGVSETSGTPSGELQLGPYAGSLQLNQYRQMFYFARYERNKLMLAGEYSRSLIATGIQFPGVSDVQYRNDERPFYLMASYRPASKLMAGIYYSYYTDRKAAFTSARFQKDWAVTARYDFSSFLYAKAEQHWMDGTAVGFDAGDNPNLAPTTRLSLLKLGVSF